MAWYFNFCAPTLPNDPTIAFHRGFQTGQVIVLLVFFAVYYTYYKVCKSDTESQQRQQKQSQASENQDHKQQKQKNQVQSQSKSDSDQSKSVSIAQKLHEEQSIDGNQSTVPFKDSGDKFLKKKSMGGSKKQIQRQKKSVTAEEIQSYFPIVFGHHAIAMGISIMYSPYAEQSIAAILYVIFSFVLIIVNSKRMSKLTNAIWMWMAFLNVFIMMSALLEVGQSNWDFVNNKCFAEEYQALY